MYVMFTNTSCAAHARRQEQKLRFHEFPIVIGRSPEADIRLDDKWLSRFHCELENRDGTLVVRDLRSRNGTLVNGCAILESPVLPGDRLTVGVTSFRVDYQQASLSAPPPVIYSSSCR